MSNKRDSKGRKAKPKMVGLAWSTYDLIQLTGSLVEIAANNPHDAIEMAGLAYRSTTMTEKQYDYIVEVILHSKVKKPSE